VELHRYEGEVWNEERPAAGLARLLARRDALVELRSGTEAADIVIGVPHHAAIGVSRIAERRPRGGRVADENAVLYALAAFDTLRGLGVSCRLLVAAHATDHDPNKRADSPYCRRALAEPAPRLLIECHGAGRRAPHDLEISAGRNGRAEPLRFGRLLARELGPGYALAVQVEPGTRTAMILGTSGAGAPGTLRFPALRTRSLSEAAARGVAALHLEAKPRFRSRGDGSDALTPPGARLGRSLGAAAWAYLEAATEEPGGR
jgi:hypothetical protein